MNTLVALLDGRQVGVVRQARGRLSFQYEDSWRRAPNAYPLSLSLPLAAREHGHAAISAFLWGLLPDNHIVLDRWARRFRVSARNPFSLLAVVGEDCAGAVQLAALDRLDALRGGGSGDIAWLTEAQVAARLRALQADISAWRTPSDTGQFSLAGAQPKTALYFDGQRWGIPSGRIATTHIAKPPTQDLDGHAENEHLCLALARSLGLPAAQSSVVQFEGITAIVVERYDRLRIPAHNDAQRGRSAGIIRVHQEDLCQALGRSPNLKYQSDGGPGPAEIIGLLRAASFGGHQGNGPTASQEDVETFISALLFNWLIAGTDAHAKNYSILIGAGGLVRLAPLYDVASVAAYPDVDLRKAKLAMKIGRTYRLHDIGERDWLAFARSVRLDGGYVLEMARTMARALPDRLAHEAAIARRDGLTHPILPRLVDVLASRTRDCLRRLG